MKTGSLVLISGVDGSGKTTLIKRFENLDNFVGHEPTHTSTSREFKTKNLATFVTNEFVDTREQFYLDLQRLADTFLSEQLMRNHNVVTSGNTLTTYVSHAAMRGVLSEQFSATNVVDRFCSGVDLKPDRLIVLHAPIDVIEERIEDRFKGGDMSEKPWGFNSPYFLASYQAAWLATANALSENSVCPVFTFDTSTMKPDDIVDSFLNQASVTRSRTS